MTAKQIIDIAKKEIGTKENPANSNCVKYNRWYYGREVHDHDISPTITYPWCCVFISWIFRTEQGLCKKTASCSDLLKWFRDRGQIVKNPQAGDIVFFKYNTNNRPANHVGLVVSVSGNVINTIEGNTSAKGSQDNGGMVMQKNRYSNIVAYARPKYATGSSTIPTGRKTNEEIAKEVKAGKWGNYPIRKQKLEEAGYDYAQIMAIVNATYNKGNK